MKPVWILLSIIALLVGQSLVGQMLLAQTLAPVVEAGSSLWPLVIVAAIGGAIYLVFLWHKRNPSKADAALADAKNEGIALAHKMGDALQNVTKSNRELTMVAVSPPIQAAVNGPVRPTPPTSTLRMEAEAPPRPAPPIAPQPTIAPVPVPAAVPAPVSPPAATPAPAPTPLEGPPAPIPPPMPVYVAPIVPNTFGITQKEMQAAALAGSASPQFQALWARIAAAGGTAQDMNNVINWYDPSGGGYKADQDERFLTDRNANLSAYGLTVWNGERWVKP